MGGSRRQDFGDAGVSSDVYDVKPRHAEENKLTPAGRRTVWSGSGGTWDSSRTRGRRRVLERGEAGDSELHAAVGEIDGGGGEGGAPGVSEAGEPDAGGESDGAAERGVCAEGGGSSCGGWACGRRGTGDNEISLALPNGSRIVGLPGTEATVRGFSAVSLLLVDEASRVSDELYQAIRPMLAVSEGSCG